jgi:murein DD-endopeptidase MepM/ murein hydrolase activator NlpD
MNCRIAVAAAVACLIAAPLAAQTLKPDEVLSSISARTISAPNPVLGADGRVHLAYELMVDNPSHFFITLDKVEAVDEAGNSLWSMEGDALAAMTKPFSANDPLPPGGLAAVFMDVSFGPDETLPGTVFARLTVTRQAIGEDGKPAPLPASSPVPATVIFTGAPTAIGAPAVVVAPPLRGKGWIAVNGCCDAITSHRGAIIAVNGQLRVPERFAIDWVKLDDDGRISSGDGKKVEDYGYYGAPVLAVADGVVVNLYDEADAQVPGEITGITTENIGGNMIVTDIGGGNFAFYAHLQRGSLEVGLGDKVTAGQQIALLGNTGNTDAPHLHFHVMDGPSPLDADGLPYVFTGFSSPGRLANVDAVEDGAPAETDAAHLAGSFTDALPLNDQVVDFD